MTRPSPVDVLVDARVTGRGHTGIARYVRELSARLSSSTAIRLAALLTHSDPPLPGVSDTVRVRSPFLHPAEQAELPLRVAAWRGISHRRGVFWVPAYNAACVTPGPMVLTIHDANHLALAENYGLQHAVYYATVVRLAARRAACVITVSEFARRELVERMGIDPGRIRVIRNGVTVPPLPSDEEIARARTAQGLPDRYVVYVGNFKAHKNLDTLLRSSIGFAKDVPLLLIGGTEAELGNALPAARSLGAKIVVLRSVPDAELWPLVAGASVFAFPSRYEGFGLPPLEAMGLGVPVVTTTAGALPEVVGDAALLANPDDDEGISRAIVRVLDDAVLATDLSAKGLVRASEFSWDVAAEETGRVMVAASTGAIG